MVPLDDFGVEVVIAAAERCSSNCLEHVGEPCVRWVDIVPQPKRRIGPANDLEYAIWEALEPRLEDVINLDLNTTDEAIAFTELCASVAAAIGEQGFVVALPKPGTPRAQPKTHDGPQGRGRSC